MANPSSILPGTACGPQRPTRSDISAPLAVPPPNITPQKGKATHTCHNIMALSSISPTKDSPPHSVCLALSPPHLQGAPSFTSGNPELEVYCYLCLGSPTLGTHGLNGDKLGHMLSIQAPLHGSCVSSDAPFSCSEPPCPVHRPGTTRLVWGHGQGMVSSPSPYTWRTQCVGGGTRCCQSVAGQVTPALLPGNSSSECHCPSFGGFEGCLAVLRG